MKNILFVTTLLLITFNVTAQADKYKYRRELKGITDEWHQVILPDDIYGKVSRSLTDIRIFCITGKDTTEAPYILNGHKSPVDNQLVAFKLINQSKNTRGYFYTFQIPAQSQVNNIYLDVKPDNFDWKVDIEGSHDQINWYTVQNNFRIVALKNLDVNFRYTKLHFPSSDYTFIRILIKSNTDPGIAGAKLFIEKPLEKTDKSYPSTTVVTNDKITGRTIIDITLKYPSPISELKISVADRFDYYRPAQILQVTDSIKTDKGWHVDFSPLAHGTLNSFDTNNFKFSSAIVRGVRVLIDNKDNAPLNIKTVTLTGTAYTLTARFDKKGKYYLYYGNRNTSAPDYDIEHFSDRIPQQLQNIETGNEEPGNVMNSKNTEPLFKNKIWLWFVIIITLVILGWFSVKMIREKQKEN